MILSSRYYKSPKCTVKASLCIYHKCGVINTKDYLVQAEATNLVHTTRHVMITKRHDLSAFLNMSQILSEIWLPTPYTDNAVITIWITLILRLEKTFSTDTHVYSFSEAIDMRAISFIFNHISPPLPSLSLLYPTLSNPSIESTSFPSLVITGGLRLVHLI